MSLAVGARLGSYEIVGVLGVGGMGEVYRARDTKLDRDVAVKVLPEAVGADPERIARFEREARTLASLNHPNIAHIHGLEESSGIRALIIELVEGLTLADRIAAGPIPTDEALAIARQIADALDAAHERGIVHRDLKPANVKITPAGVVKVLDFGLAKQAGSTLYGGDLENSPTMNPATVAGVILGTAAYMAPEQARGQAVDKRADIWAFGVVLYEMFAGTSPFRGATVSDTLAAVLTAEPDLTNVPPGMRPLLRRCLVKDPRRRLRDIGDVDLAPQIPSAAGTGPSRSKSWVGWAAAAGVLIALAPIAVLHVRERPTAAAPMRFQIPSSVTLATSGNIGLSPDGRHLAFLAAGADGMVRIWIREMDSVEMRPLPGSEAAANGPPFFWSPDSRFIAFESDRKLKKLNVGGGPAQVLCDLPGTAIGGSWNLNGDIIVGNIAGAILRVPEGGGTASPVTTIDPSRKENSHIVPTFLPDGRHFVYVRVSRTSPESSGIYLGALDRTDAQSPVRLLPYASGLTYAPSADGGGIGHLLFVREGTLLAQPFDERRLQLAGDAVPIAEQVGVFLDTAFVSVSPNGVLVYRTADPPFPITWFDRKGMVLGRVSEPGQYASVALSPDGSRAVAALTNPRDRATADLWLIDLARGGGGRTRFTFDPGVRADLPIWSPDGKRIAFRAGGPGATEIRQKRVGAAQDQEDVIERVNTGLVTPLSWSPDGRFLLFARPDPVSAWDLWVLPVDGGQSKDARKAVPFARTRFNEQDGRFSPNGHWIAYVSNESGTNEIYVRAFTQELKESAGIGESTLISRGGGTAPRWRRDGKELFYLALDGKMMAVDVAGPEFRAGTPAPLFQAPPGAIVGDATPDGQRFLLVQSGAAPFTVVLNWTATIQK